PQIEPGSAALRGRCSRGLFRRTSKRPVYTTTTSFLRLSGACPKRAAHFGSQRMKVLFLTDGPSIPGSRYRCLQYFPHLEARGISCSVQFAYDERYNSLVQTVWSKPYRLAGRLRRASRMLTARGYDVLYL